MHRNSASRLMSRSSNEIFRPKAALSSSHSDRMIVLSTPLLIQSSTDMEIKNNENNLSRRDVLISLSKDCTLSSLTFGLENEFKVPIQFDTSRENSGYQIKMAFRESACFGSTNMIKRSTRIRVAENQS